MGPAPAVQEKSAGRRNVLVLNLGLFIIFVLGHLAESAEHWMLMWGTGVSASCLVAGFVFFAFFQCMRKAETWLLKTIWQSLQHLPWRGRRFFLIFFGFGGQYWLYVILRAIGWIPPCTAGVLDHVVRAVCAFVVGCFVVCCWPAAAVDQHGYYSQLGTRN